MRQRRGIATHRISTGVIPRTYVKHQENQPPIQYVEALWDYQAKHLKMSSGDTDVSFKKSDIMVCLRLRLQLPWPDVDCTQVFLEHMPNDWMRIIHRGCVGVIPGNYVKLLAQKRVRAAGMFAAPSANAPAVV